jgi:hypothetical protein
MERKESPETPPHPEAPRPRDPAANIPLPEMRQPGYYPGFSTLGQQSFWDEATRRVVLDRMSNIPPVRFFTPEEQATLSVVLDHIVPQSDREPSRRIPILPFIDQRLETGRIDGYRYLDMPPDGESYRIGLAAIERMAQDAHGRWFGECTYAERERMLQSLEDKKPLGGHALWKKLDAYRFWTMMLHDAASVYCAHPWAWDEVGFGGPAYPRGYMRLERGRPEPWEVNERRYAWRAPEGCLSDLPDNEQY